jgi:hypothetical protein
MRRWFISVCLCALLALAEDAAPEENPIADMNTSTSYVFQRGYLHPKDSIVSPDVREDMWATGMEIEAAKVLCLQEPACNGFSYSAVDGFVPADQSTDVWFMNGEATMFEFSESWGTFVKCSGVLPRTGGGWIEGNDPGAIPTDQPTMEPTTTPTARPTFTFAPSQRPTKSGYDLATVRGKLFHDLDGDGLQDKDERSLDHNKNAWTVYGWTLYFDMNDNGKLDDDEPFVVTKKGGFYSIEGVSTEEAVTIRLEPKGGWTATYPAEGSYSLRLSPSEARLDVDFGVYSPPAALKPGGVAGLLWEDVNGDGRMDHGDYRWAH